MEEEKIVEIKKCRFCSSSFGITDRDLEFYDKVSPVFSGKKYSIPAPTLCPDCRQQRRLSFRNERKLYKRKCDLTGKEIISIYSPDKIYKVYDQKEWWSDKWDAMDYCPAGGIDFGRGFFEQFDELMKEVPIQGLLQEFCENSEYVNDGVFNKNCYLCFTSFEVENSLYSNNIFWSKNCIDVFWSTKSENCYDSIYLNNCNFLFFCKYCYDSSNCYYVSHSIGLDNCSFSIGLTNSKFRFLNKQYSKEEYEKLVPKIIEHMKKTGEWGEFFPSNISPFGYNETVAMEYYPIPHPIPQKQPHPDPLLRGEGERFNWSTYESPFPKVEKIIPASKLPDNIKDIPDDILNWVIECEVTKKPFRIIKQELEFYRKHNLPIPRRHHDQRHLDRMLLRNPRKLFDRKCDKCGKVMKTTYNPERKEIVYCEECYNKEV